ncbi:helix-turn-helix domain-containing protein [Actinomadura sp. DC4]|uniref:PucR family transcriptional regulator n=1 Tax=Actinomadura sp. DC4 TaxID=3055069 RepID=UPI0025B153DD|nr:helix-turn-helix domain-containing protein [Actinomadura sp. DC4]MDN3354442.1 helix-turn-helix domain-containing protein [Actinomadura sp. DC4]
MTLVQQAGVARPRASLGRVVDDLGATLLELAHGDPHRPGEISAVVFHDPLDQPVLPPHALVLGVGVDAPGHIAALLRTLGHQNAAALVLRAPVPLTDEVRAAADEAAVAVLGLRRGAPWGHLSEMLRSLLARGAGVESAESLGGLPAGDLFAVANAIAALLDAPITIEDRNSRVLAFSGRQDEADPSRVETILGRQVPERYARMLHEGGVFRDLLRSDQPVFIEPISDGMGGFTLPRVAISVRAGDEVLGSIWAAVPARLSDERNEALRESAKLVALHMLRVRAGADVQRRVRADLLSTALEGGVGAGEALERLGLSSQPLLVLGVALDERGPHYDNADSAAVVHDRQRLSDAFALHLSAIHPRSAAAAIGAVTYGLVPMTGAAETAETRAVGILQDFLDRVGDRLPPITAVGPVALDLSDVAHSRSCVDRVLRVLRDRRLHRRIGRFDEMQGEALISELRDLAGARSEEPTGALARLIAYDRRHRGNLVQTLRAWLDAFGDVVMAAESVGVHQNTFRYRFRRVAEVGQCDLSDPDQRFAMMVQLQVLRVDSPPDP